jgi:hypothetical protein
MHNPKAGSRFTGIAHRCTRPGLTFPPRAFNVSASPAATTRLCPSRHFEASGVHRYCGPSPRTLTTYRTINVKGKSTARAFTPGLKPGALVRLPVAVSACRSGRGWAAIGSCNGVHEVLTEAWTASTAHREAAGPALPGVCFFLSGFLDVGRAARSYRSW